MTRNSSDRPAEVPNALARVILSEAKDFTFGVATLANRRMRTVILRVPSLPFGMTAFGASPNRDGEHAPLVHFHRNFFEAGHTHQFVHLSGGAPAHDPGFAFAIAQNVRDKLDLRMPRLIRVNQITPRLDRAGQSAK